MDSEHKYKWSRGGCSRTHSCRHPALRRLCSALVKGSCNRTRRSRPRMATGHSVERGHASHQIPKAFLDLLTSFSLTWLRFHVGRGPYYGLQEMHVQLA